MHYEDNNCSPKVGVLPDSIYVQISTNSGNLKYNLSTCAFADAPTDAYGNTRITLWSFSGWGKLRLKLFVSEATFGIKYALVRSTDTNADHSVTSTDTCLVCSQQVADVNYDGSRNLADQLLVASHLGQSLPNVVWNIRPWTIRDSLSACPAGDSLLAAHPSRIRIPIYYLNSSYSLKVGVPPESIWVTTAITSGNLRVNDQAATIPADFATQSCGPTRVTIPSFSGCGKVNVNLFVNGIAQGTRELSVNTTDTDADADGRVTSGDTGSPCDLNWDGSPNDTELAGGHLNHWRRNALHGQLVQRTTLPVGPVEGAIGESQVFWSPSGRWLSYTVHGPGSVYCHVSIVPSDPAIGDQPKQFTWTPDTSDRPELVAAQHRDCLREGRLSHRA